MSKATRGKKALAVEKITVHGHHCELGKHVDGLDLHVKEVEIAYESSDVGSVTKGIGRWSQAYCNGWDSTFGNGKKSLAN